MCEAHENDIEKCSRWSFVLSTIKMSKSRMENAENENSSAKIGADTAENESREGSQLGGPRAALVSDQEGNKKIIMK